MKRILFAAAVALAVSAHAAEPFSTAEALVAPIAFYPDVVLGQVLAASGHPHKLERAQVWLKGKLDRRRPADAAEIAQALDGEGWAPDIKALAMLPGLLDALCRDFAWVHALGESYETTPAALFRAVQRQRRQALAAGTLLRTSTQDVIDDGQTIVIQPADPASAEVPGIGRYDIGVFERFSWGWHSWSVDWRRGLVRFQDLPYQS